ncbi:hyaluronidase-2-like [Acipenser ruthenus]|uniref:hyaluronidase-2-like n=1 Tax=Acipenser ruthenus TaxID=7906 RepID=UPI00274185A3|nr:hyaluronidase-2-like [Acipenser ruthenus]XP_058856078.1 hyaluronidase-2-like [Acipenser ruthenus]XP_058856079.1 hyaluronidase-2-like [Acipenser ruthenus]XP_058856080.1 hyaluronidase-2-like [Acipenser ruthenus]XP_058856081.1 hyaluronidase-2-like [Acipenser ruthenus]XP_058856082.1 hyaluronidase-2-like [Acipenser ruthenus]
MTKLSFRICLLLLAELWACCWGERLKLTSYPIFSQKPFALVWNAPTEDCRPRYGVTLNLKQFQVTASPNEGFVGQKLTIFYKDRLGLYPYHTEKGQPVNGGIPQLAHLGEHLAKMPEGMDKYIRDSQSSGLAVIDWEEWRPLWIRNWDTKDVYRNISRSMIAQKNPGWTKEQLNKMAQVEFEASAKEFMLQTLRMAKSLRPNQLWGYYLFPDCYNHDYKNSLKDYTGRCPDVEISRNDQLDWLWEESTALYPSIYMGTVLRSSESGRQFVRNRVKEAIRLASVGEGLARPVFVYTRPTYSNGLELLSQMDLVYTIGESAALGAAGLIFWGDATHASSSASCGVLRDTLQGTLGSYLLNVSMAAQLCSSSRCSLNGRCVRLNPNTNTYLHLNARSFQITQEEGSLKVKGELSSADKDDFRRDFICQCYSGYSGDSCVVQEAGARRGAALCMTPSIAALLAVLALQVLL